MPETTHEGNDPMGAPSTHRGRLEDCPAPDCQDRVIEQQEDAPDPHPTATVTGQSIALNVTGYPDIPNRWGTGHIRVTALRLDYGNTRSPAGRHAFITGLWVRKDGEVTDQPIDQYYDAPDGDTSTWPDWIADLARTHTPVDRAAVLREEAALIRAHCPDHLDSNSAEGAWIGCHCDVADDMERRAAKVQQPDTPEWARPETEEEKLAKARRMAKALSAPPVTPPEWASTREWPNRHKRRGDRRVHATAPFETGVTRQFWTACEKPVGQGGYAINHMPVDCRDCKRATTAVPVQPAAAETDKEA